MRKFKFRAWDKRNNCWYEPGTGFEIHWLGGFITHKNGESRGWGGDIPFDIMQFTGLNDKNGIPIYEGDIVQQTNFLNEIIGVFDVQWGQFGFTLHDPKREEIKHYYASPDMLEVIGNVYENFDLLKP